VSIPLVLAHGLSGRADLPLALGVFVGAVAVVLAVSFAALAAGWIRPKLEHPRERPLVRLPLVVDIAGGLAGVFGFLLAVYAGLAGTDIAASNLLPTVVYVALWIGVPMVSLVFGDVFRLVSPWRAAGRAVGWVIGRADADATEALDYPDRLGQWPAAAGIAAFAIVELCWSRGDDPQVLAVLAIAYAVVQLIGMGLYGVEPWSRNGDAFGVYFSLFARLSAFGRREDGMLVVRVPGSAAAGLTARAGTVALLVAAIGSTTFDGAKEGVLFDGLFPNVQDALFDAGFSKSLGLELAFLLGLALTVAFVAAVYVSGARSLRRPLAHSLIPIAAAYVVAHYFSLAVFGLQALPALLADPLDARPDIDYGVVSTNAIWWVQVTALVVGHVAALVLAHDRALAVHGSARDAAKSQIAMVVVMIVFSCVGLWQLSAANQA